MLILTRKPEESIIVGHDAAIEFMVMSVKGNQVRIGINAPKDIPIHRKEIYQRIQQGKKQNPPR